jgi:hypothetical protein
VSDAEHPTSSAALEERPPEAPAAGGGALVGYLAEFPTVDAILAAAEACRDEGFTRWDCHTPFPVHGLDRAMGLRQTLLPWIALGGGVAGCLTGLGLQWFTNAFDYPFLVSGKPVFSFAVYIPVMFELTVLFSALACFVGMLALNDLPRLYHPVFRSARFARATDDRFFVSVDASDPRFDEVKTRAFLEGLEPDQVERLEE